MPDPHIRIGPVLDLGDGKGVPPLLILSPTENQVALDTTQGYRWQERSRLCPGAKGAPAPCGAALLPGKKLCPACRQKARRAVNRRAQAAFRARKKAKENADVTPS